LMVTFYLKMENYVINLFIFSALNIFKPNTFLLQIANIDNGYILFSNCKY